MQMFGKTFWENSSTSIYKKKMRLRKNVEKMKLQSTKEKKKEMQSF